MRCGRAACGRVDTGLRRERSPRRHEGCHSPQGNAGLEPHTGLKPPAPHGPTSTRPRRPHPSSVCRHSRWYHLKRHRASSATPSPALNSTRNSRAELGWVGVLGGVHVAAAHTHTQLRVRSALDHTRHSIYTREHGCPESRQGRANDGSVRSSREMAKRSEASPARRRCGGGDVKWQREMELTWEWDGAGAGNGGGGVGGK